MMGMGSVDTLDNDAEQGWMDTFLCLARCFSRKTSPITGKSATFSFR
jgi:hypothetical protein